MSQDQTETASELVGDFPFWMRLGDQPWCDDLNDPPHEYVLVDGREVLVERSLAQGIHIVDLKFWSWWVIRLGFVAIPFMGLGWLRQHQISLRIHNLGLTASKPTFVARVKKVEILRTTDFELARDLIRREIKKR